MCYHLSGVRSLYVLRLLEYSSGTKESDRDAQVRIKSFFRAIHRRQRFGYKVGYFTFLIFFVNETSTREGVVNCHHHLISDMLWDRGYA